MSKIELTDQQAGQIFEAYKCEVGGKVASITAILNKAIELGLVRPASDDPMQREWEDVKARVAALEAYINGDEPGVPPNVRPPDPHAAAKERAKLWRVELVTLKDGTCLFMTEKHYLSNPKPSWFPHVFSFRSPHYSGGHKTPSEAWSNFPTEPPPGWEAKTIKVGDKVDGGVAIASAASKSRTEADRLGEVAWKADGGALEGDEWANDRDTSPARRQAYRTIALAVRKADRASQLEPSEEEIDKACNAYLPHYAASTPSVVESVRRGVTAALIAAARVRLEKAEGER